MNCVEPEERLWSEISAICEDEGLCLYDLERRGQNWLRVMVERRERFLKAAESEGDASGSQGGSRVRVTSGELSRLCRRLMVFMGVSGPLLDLSSEPEIDVCSPGVERHLRLVRHFEGAVGERAKILVRREGNGKSEDRSEWVVGIIRAATAERVDVLCDGGRGPVEIEFSRIAKAQTLFDFGAGAFSSG